jgi:hypothetical protein
MGAFFVAQAKMILQCLSAAPTPTSINFERIDEMRYWIFRYDDSQQGYVPAGGDYTPREDQALRYCEGRDDTAIYRYDHAALPPILIPSPKLASGSFLDDTRETRKPGRPVEREGEYQRITLEVRDDLLKKIDASGKSRREFIEELLEANSK